MSDPIHDLIAEVDSRFGLRSESDQLRFDKQVAFAKDPAHFRAAICGRRAGKTREAMYMFRDSMGNHPGDTHVFVELTRPSAKNKLWRPFNRLNRELNWGLKFYGHDGLRVEHPNGAMLHVVGANQWDEIEKIRGLERVRLAWIDECGQQKPTNLKYLVEDVLEPGLMDVNGTLILTGTPGVTLTGYWYDVTTKSDGWSVHHWTVYDNPHVDGAGYIKELFKRRGIDADDPVFIREYLGKWVRDETRLIFAYGDDNVIDKMPTMDSTWTTVLSIDFGTVSSTAWCLLAYPKYGTKLYIVKSFKEPGLSPTEVAGITRDLIDEWRPETIIGDLHGLGKAYAQEMRKRFGIILKPANKQDKRGTIEYVSDAFRTGQLLNCRLNATLDVELRTLIWDEEHYDLEDGQDDHETEALIYGFRECPTYFNAIVPPIEERIPMPPWVDRDGVPVKEPETPYWAMEEEW